MRSPVQIVGLRQPRCSLRFGIGACPATGAPKCYNTWPTCQAQAAFVNDGMIEWLFIANRPGLWPFGDFTDPDAIRTNCIPVNGMTVSTAKAQINAAGVLEGKSPFGVLAQCTVTMQDRPWDDHVGDFYIGDRVNLPERTFWSVWHARNRFFGGMELVVYDGFEGEPFESFRKRTYVLDRVQGPDGDGRVTLLGVSPLVSAEGKRALFPAAMDMRLVQSIDDVQTTIRVTTNDQTNLTKAFGISTLPGIVVGTEVMFYTGYSEVSAGVYDLEVQRGRLKTVAAEANAEARVQRIGYFQNTQTWQCGRHLLAEHSPVGLARLDAAMWEEEGGDYLSSLRSDTVILSPTPVFDLMGEICQQGMFFCWWDEYAALVKMQAVRPPRGAVQKITGAAHIVADSARITMQPEASLTRVFVYYGPADLTKSDKANFRVVDGTIETENEDPRSGGQARTLEIMARWVKTEAHAQQIISRILSRYRNVPRFVTIHVAEKDSAITVGDVCDLTQRSIVDAEGRLITTRWQVISWDEVKPGEIYALDLQTYELIGRFGGWMADDAPDYVDATEEQRAEGAWWADDDGLMPDGTQGYQWS